MLSKIHWKLLKACVNNDSIFLCKNNIIDYSLLTMINEKKKTIRFAIIDYLQQYSMDKKLESKFKGLLNSDIQPTIINAEEYKKRFKTSIQQYFIGT